MGKKGTGKGVSKKQARSKQASPKAEGEANSDPVKSAEGADKLISQKKQAAGSANKARLVITHSTYIPGLIKVLEKLACCAEIQTITPAVISRVKSNSPGLRLKVSVPITGGYKLIARKSRSAQEVFVITHWGKAALEQAIAQILP